MYNVYIFKHTEVNCKIITEDMMSETIEDTEKDCFEREADRRKAIRGMESLKDEIVDIIATEDIFSEEDRSNVEIISKDDKVVLDFTNLLFIRLSIKFLQRFFNRFRLL